MIQKYSLELLASEARTTSGNADKDLAPGANGHLLQAMGRKGVAYLNITAASGTSPTLDVKLEDSADGVTFYTVATFAQKVAAGAERIVLNGPIGRHLRVAYTVGGTTPSFTFDVKAILED